MADALNVGFGFPFNATGSATAAGFSTFLLDSNTDKVGWSFQARGAITITHLGYRQGTTTGTPVAHQISLQALNATGTGDGTVLGGGTPASASFTPAGANDGTWVWVALANSYTTTRGQFLAIVLEPTGAADVNNNITVGYAMPLNTWNDRWVRPFGYTINAGGSPVRLSETPIWGYKDASRSYGMPVEAFASLGFSSNSTPDEYALKFTLPAGWGSTFQVIGVRVIGSVGTAAKSETWTLYDGTTALQQISVDTDYASANTTSTVYEVYFDEATLSTLNYGTAYRLAVTPVDTATTSTLLGITAKSNAELSAFAGGVNFYLNTRTDAGVWTDDTTVNNQRPMIMPLFDDFTEPAGGAAGGTKVISADGMVVG